MLANNGYANCGSTSAVPASWTGVTNPKTADSFAATTATFNLGTARAGVAGEYRMCFRSTSSANTYDYVTEIGVLVLKGPQSGQSFECTLGTQCLVSVAGFELPAAPAEYGLVIVLDSGAGNPCGTGAVQASFTGLENPDTVEDDVRDTDFDMGIPTAGDTTASYAACWGNRPSSLTDYIYLVGSFTMNGPANGQSHSCTMGRACTITLTGTGFVATNAILIAVGDSQICQYLIDAVVTDFGTSFSNPDSVTAPGYTSFSMGKALQAHNNLPGSGYRVCWASAPTLTPPAKQVSDYRLDTGSFTLNGPVKANQACTLTSKCQFTLTGSGLTLGAHGVLVLDAGETCGDINATLVAISSLPELADLNQSWQNPTAAEIDTFTLGVPTQGVGSSSYVLCWGFQPNSVTDYNVQLGTFTLGGPDVMSGTSCTKGLACNVVLTGLSLAASNKILVIATGASCGQGAVAASFSPMLVEKQVQNDGAYRQFQLGLPNSGVAASGYSLCWGASPASIADYYFSLSDFTVFGPNVRAMSCTFGLPCELQLVGHGLASTNRLIVLSNGQCGDNAPTSAVVTGMLASISVDASSSGERYDLNTPLAGQPRADYKVCWAHSPSNVAGAAVYSVPVGLLTLNGPVQNSQLCSLGVDCVITLTGVGLAASNQILLIDDSSSCGDESPTLATFSGLSNPTSPEASDFGEYRLGIPRTTPEGPGSGYKVCWGHNPVNHSQWAVLLGTFSMDGPNVIGSPVTCTMGLACSLQVTGVNLASTNKITITANTDVCGQSNLNTAVFPGTPNPISVQGAQNNQYDLGMPTGGVPGDYKVCWSFSGSSEGNFHVPVATLRMGGPAAQDNSCTLSEPCRIVVQGVRLAHTSRLLFISQTSNCGDANAVPLVWSGINNPASTALLSPPVNPGFVYNDGDTYDAGLGFAGLPGTTYRICWGFNPVGGPADFKVTLGSFVMNGPVQGMTVACVLGKACAVTVAGTGLAASNQIQLATDAASCGAADLVMSNFQGFSNPTLVRDDSMDNQYLVGLATSGGSYGSCKVPVPAGSCIGTHYRICWAHGVYSPAGGPNFVVDLGVFQLSGPHGTYSVECTMGSVCAFKVYGSALLSTNRVLIIEASSNCGDSNALVASFTGLINPQICSEVASDGTEITVHLGRSSAGRTDTYKLCWGYNPYVLSDYNVEVGPFKFKAVPGGCSAGAFSVSCAAYN